MPRRTGFNSLLNASIKAMRQVEVERKRKEREQIRSKVLRSKQEKYQYLQMREIETQEKNVELDNKISEFDNILELGLLTSAPIVFDDLKYQAQGKRFVVPQELKEPLISPNKDDFVEKVQSPNFLKAIFPGVKERYQDELNKANDEYITALQSYKFAEEARKERLIELQNAFEKESKEHDQHVEEFKKAYLDCNIDAIKTYNSLLLDKSEYPENFPQEFQIAYAPDSKELIIDYLLPSKDIIPNISEYRYVKTKDIIQEKPRKSTEIKKVYQDIIASITLRTINEVVVGDQNNTISVIDFNGYVNAIDPATGKDIHPCLISLRVMKENFQELQLNRIDKIICLRDLGAKVSSRPDEMQAVKPVIEFDMIDKRYVEQNEILDNLDDRPNLMDLNWFEFENLVSNLFTRMGLDTKQTRSAKDGGVDAIAYDIRPVLGGKVIIQAKRYKNIVGVSAVRDLYGTMMNEGANKGILVTTSHYGPDAYDFAKSKPIELIDGGGLLYLLDQHGVSAKIVFPLD